MQSYVICIKMGEPAISTVPFASTVIELDCKEMGPCAHTVKKAPVSVMFSSGHVKL